MPSRPNFLFILTDQHTPLVLGSHGNPVVRTPNLDLLASQGVRFEQAYCQNPLCVPSRSSLLTGRYSRAIGIYENRDILEPNCSTLPRILSAHGYRTCLIGKAHFNGDQFHGYQQRPYGDFYGQGHQPDPRRPGPEDESGLAGGMRNSGATAIPLPLTQTEICVAEAAKWLQAHVALHPGQPFFLSLNFDKPHFPMRCPEQYFTRYRGRVRAPLLQSGYETRAVPFVREAMRRFGGYDPETERIAREAYYGCVEWVDDAVGRVLDIVDYLGLGDDTVVIYSSDHGELGGSHGAWNKTLFFDASARVPLIWRWPNRFPDGQHWTDIVGLIDVFPTICDLAGIRPPALCDGESLVSMLLGEGGLGRNGVFCESAFLNEPDLAGCMVRTDQWKYSYYLDGEEELYDMEADPGEWTNLAGSRRQAGVVAALRERVFGFWRPDEQLQRAASTPKVQRQKHWYEFSNQFSLGDGTVADARP